MRTSLVGGGFDYRDTQKFVEFAELAPRDCAAHMEDG